MFQNLKTVKIAFFCLFFLYLGSFSRLGLGIQIITSDVECTCNYTSCPQTKGFVWTDCSEFYATVNVEALPEELKNKTFFAEIDTIKGYLVSSVRATSFEEILSRPEENMYVFKLKFPLDIKTILTIYEKEFSTENRAKRDHSVVWSTQRTYDYRLDTFNSYFRLVTYLNGKESPFTDFLLVDRCSQTVCDSNKIKTEIISKINCVGGCDSEAEKVFAVLKYLSVKSQEWLTGNPSGYRYFRINPESEANGICIAKNICDPLISGFGHFQGWHDATHYLLNLYGIETQLGHIARDVIKLKNDDGTLSFCGIPDDGKYYIIDPMQIIFTGTGNIGSCDIATTNVPNLEPQPTPLATPMPSIDNPFASPTFVNMIPGTVSEAVETVCDDWYDNDYDGHVDCNDTDCAEREMCKHEQFNLCNDKLDNDFDNFIDCEDVEDCYYHSTCLAENMCALAKNVNWAGRNCCEDNTDNDDDGYRDCKDRDCYHSQNCVSARDLDKERKNEIVSKLKGFWDAENLSPDLDGCVEEESETTEVKAQFVYNPVSDTISITFNVPASVENYNYVHFNLRDMNGAPLACTETRKDGLCVERCSEVSS